MRQSWTQGLEPERAKDVRANFKESLVMRRRLLELLDKKINASVRNGRSITSYDNPNWALLQADARGYERAIQEVLDLLNDKSTDS